MVVGSAHDESMLKGRRKKTLSIQGSIEHSISEVPVQNRLTAALKA
jgi:hypothetical protein